MLDVDLEIINEVKNLCVFIVYDVIKGVDNSTYPPELEREIKSAVEEARRLYSLDALKEHSIIRAYRDFYWRVLKIDPTKQRPSQEALLRRILRGGDLPRISPVVDIGNAVSIKYLVPIGLYDISKIRGGKLRLRLSERGELFYPIGGGVEELEGQIVLAAGGQILHVYPYRDSVETKIDVSTRDVLAVVAGVRGVDLQRLIDAANALRRFFKILGGEPVGDIKSA